MSSTRQVAEATIIQGHTQSTDVTVDNTSNELVAASAGTYRVIQIHCTDESIRVAIGQTAVATQGFLIEEGEKFTIVTDQAVDAIRAGGSDATVIVNILTV